MADGIQRSFCQISAEDTEVKADFPHNILRETSPQRILTLPHLFTRCLLFCLFSIFTL